MNLVVLRADDVDVERDRLLVRRYQAGDDDAFDELYRRYHDRLQRFVRKRVGDDHTAEELTQEAFTRAITALPDLSGELRFYPWISVIASRLCVDTYRRQCRSEPAPNPDPGAVTGGQDDIIDAVDAAMAVAAMARLAPRHQGVLHLREIEGWSYQRIAEHYGVTVGTVETLLFRARRALRREFHLVDRAGLAALPLLGRLVQVAVRVRNRAPAWLPAAPSPTTWAATATATAAAVALSVVPGRVPLVGHQTVAAPHATTHRAAPAKSTHHEGGGAPGAPSGPAVAMPAPAALGPPVTPTGPAAYAASTAAAVSPTGTATGAPVTTTPDPPAAAAVRTAGLGTDGGGVATTTTTIAGVLNGLPVAVGVPPLSGVTAGLPTLSAPSVPALPATPSVDLDATAGTAGNSVQDTVSQLVGGLLPGGQ